MSKKKSFLKEFEKSLGGLRTISYVFLGVGLCLFLLNISGMLSFLPDEYSFTAFDISVFSSMLIIIFSVYVLNHSKK